MQLFFLMWGDKNCIALLHPSFCMFAINKIQLYHIATLTAHDYKGKQLLKIDYFDIGERIRYYRNKNRLSQEQLAEIVNLSNVHISYIERGERIPSLDVVINIANALHISTDDLLSGSLANTSSTAIYEDYTLLRDCSKEEQQIIKRVVKTLKISLKQYRKTR